MHKDEKMKLMPILHPVNIKVHFHRARDCCMLQQSLALFSYTALEEQKLAFIGIALDGLRSRTDLPKGSDHA